MLYELIFNEGYVIKSSFYRMKSLFKKRKNKWKQLISETASFKSNAESLIMNESAKSSNLNENQMERGKMELGKAQAIAEKLIEEFRPYCERVEVAGSIRRKKEFVKDIELVVIPKKILVPKNPQLSFFDEAEMIEQWSPGYIEVVNRYKAIRGKAIGKATQRLLPEGIVLDLFTANEKNWGMIYAFRTGSADYSHFVLAGGYCKRGYRSVDGFLTRDGNLIEVPEEEVLYKIIGMQWIEPEERIYPMVA